MNSIPISDKMTIIFILIDDWYQANATHYRKGQPGQRPEFSGSEMMSVMTTMVFIPFQVSGNLSPTYEPII